VTMQGRHSVGEFYSVAMTRNMQLAATGPKMLHLVKNTRSKVISKGLSAVRRHNSYRGLVKVRPTADTSRKLTQCGSDLAGDRSGAHTCPYIESRNKSAQLEHEATTSKIGEDQVFYLNQRGIDAEKAVGLIVNGYAKEVLNLLPMEFAV